MRKRTWEGGAKCVNPCTHVPSYPRPCGDGVGESWGEGYWKGRDGGRLAETGVDIVRGLVAVSQAWNWHAVITSRWLRLTRTAWWMVSVCKVHVKNGMSHWNVISVYATSGSILVLRVKPHWGKILRRELLPQFFTNSHNDLIHSMFAFGCRCARRLLICFDSGRKCVCHGNGSYSYR